MRHDKTVDIVTTLWAGRFGVRIYSGATIFFFFVTSAFRRSVNEIFALLRCYTALIVNLVTYVSGQAVQETLTHYL